MAVNKEEVKKKRSEKLRETTGDLNPDTLKRVVEAVMKQADLEKLSNQELAERIVDGPLYGTQIIFSDSEMLLSEVINRLLDGRIPESWEGN